MQGYHKLLVLLFTIVLLFEPRCAFAQKKLNWYTTVGMGMTNIRNFNTHLNDIDFSKNANDAYISYRVTSKPNYMLSVGIGVSGHFSKERIFGWDAGLNIRSAGFRLSASLQESQGELPDVLKETLPEFGKTKGFRYWSLHLPFSIHYNPFQIVGFTIGADIYYQTTASLTESEYPHGQIGQGLGFSHSYTPKYRHPFQVGGHIGVFAPLGEKLRLDMLLNTDIASRLNVSPSNKARSDWKFREMGLSLNARYYLGW